MAYAEIKLKISRSVFFKLLKMWIDPELGIDIINLGTSL